MENLEISHLQGGEKIMEQTYYLVLAEVGRFQTFWLGIWEDESIVYVETSNMLNLFHPMRKLKSKQKIHYNQMLVRTKLLNLLTKSY